MGCYFSVRMTHISRQVPPPRAEAKGWGGLRKGIKDEREEEGGEMKADTVKAEFP